MEQPLDKEGVGYGVPPPPNNLRHLFPTTIKCGWTTAAQANEHNSQIPISHVHLSDSELRVHRITTGTTHKVCTLSDGISKAWEAVYKKGSYKPSGEIKGGFGFYVKGPGASWEKDMENATEVIFGYSVRFQENFDFVKGGKLPGIFGGKGDKAYSCSGGRQTDRCSCFDLRLMWRANGQGELYAYLPLVESNERRLLAVPKSRMNHDFGCSVGSGSFNFTPGAWVTVAERVKLNDPGEENGEVQLWINGVSRIHVSGLILRQEKEAVVRGLHFQTFFGGGTADWASPKEQRAWFCDVSGAIIM